jgi:hypothetical protein
MRAHIRRTDEVNVTECDLLTAYDAEITDAPIAVGARDVAVFPDVEAPAGYTPCHACWTAYAN